MLGEAVRIICEERALSRGGTSTSAAPLSSVDECRKFVKSVSNLSRPLSREEIDRLVSDALAPARFSSHAGMGRGEVTPELTFQSRPSFFPHRTTF